MAAKLNEEMAPIDRLRIGAATAASVRRAVEAPRRKIHVVDRKTGKVTGFVSESDVARGALALHEIEFSTVEGVRPKRAICKACGRSFAVPKKGLVPKICPEHAKQKVCAGLEGPCPKGKVPGKHAFLPVHVGIRRGKPWRCGSCSTRKWQAAMTPQQRSEAMRKGNAAMTPEQRSEAMRKANAAKTPAQRSERVRKANATRTPQQRSEATRKGNAAFTPERRSEIKRKAYATRRATAAARAAEKEGER